MASLTLEKDIPTLTIDGEGIKLPCIERPVSPINFPRIESGISSNGKGQDWCTHFNTNDGQLMVVCDGHGTDTVIDRIRNFDFGKFCENIKDLEPDTVINEVQKVTDTPDTIQVGKIGRNSGSTITVVVATTNNIKIAWLGDSSALLFKDFELILTTREHSSTQDSEGIKYISEKNNGKDPCISSYSCQVGNTGKMEQIWKPYIKHANYLQGTVDKCALTRALGHGGHTYGIPEKITIPIDSNSSWKLIIASDGLHDVIGKNQEDLAIISQMSADELVNIATYRWSKDFKWLFVPHGDEESFYTNFNENDADDVVVSIWERIVDN